MKSSPSDTTSQTFLVGSISSQHSSTYEIYTDDVVAHGFPPDVPTWGRLLFDAKDFLDIAAHWALFPGGAIFVAVVAINFIGDGMRDALDARRVI